MDHYIKQGQIRGRLCTYKETRNGLVGADYSSKLSPYMATGDYFCVVISSYSTTSKVCTNVLIGGTGYLTEFP